MNKTALIVSGRPGTANVGQILLREMLATLDDERIFIANLTHTNHPEEDATRENGLSIAVPMESARRKGRPGKLGTLHCLTDRYGRYRNGIANAAATLNDLLVEEAPKRLWAVLNCTAVIDVCWRLVQQTDVPLYVQVWDDPRHILRQRGLDRWTIRKTLRRFDDLLARAERLAVVSDPMKQDYASRTSAKLFVIRHGVDGTTKSRAARSGRERFVIGLSGAMYAETAWRSLQGALELLNWELAGRRVELIVMGSRIEFRAASPVSARFLGWHGVQEVVEQLSSCDLLYLSQSFAPLDEPLTRLSFPTKLSSYVATGLPVFIHSPVYGSLSHFSGDHNFGLLCNQLDPAVVAETLRRIEDDTFCLSLAEGSRRIGREVLSRARFVESVREFLQ